MKELDFNSYDAVKSASGLVPVTKKHGEILKLEKQYNGILIFYKWELVEIPPGVDLFMMNIQYSQKNIITRLKFTLRY